MFVHRNYSLDPDSVTFAIRAHFYNDDQTLIIKKSDDSNSQKLFLLSKFCKKDFFANMPKTFTISTKNSTLHFNLQMLKATSPVISKFIQSNPNENNYNIDITDDDNVLAKFSQLYQGKNIFFKEDEIHIVQRFTEILQIKNCPNYLKTSNLLTNEIDTEGNRYNLRYFGSSYQIFLPLQAGVTLYQKWFINFIQKDEFLTFTIVTKQKEYKCSIFGIYISDSIRKLLEVDPTIDKFYFEFEDSENEFQLICDFFNGKMVDITNYNMDSLKSIAEALQIKCILQSIDNYINNYEKVSQKLDEQQSIIDSIDELFDLLCNINKHGIEKVKLSIVNSKWSKKDRYVQELAAFILQVVKPTFSIQKEMAELLIELNKEANDDNQLDLLIPFIVKKLMTLYWPQSSKDQQQDKKEKENEENEDEKLQNNQPRVIIEKREEDTMKTLEDINLNNRCIYSFIRILYKKGIIPKEEVFKKLKDYDLSNNFLNVFFLPEIVQINPKSIGVIDSIYKSQTSLPIFYSYHFGIQRNFNSLNLPRFKIAESKAGLYYYWSFFVQKYLPDKIDSYEKMLDSMEPDDELTKSIIHDDVDTLQRIINQEGIDIQKGKVPYNIFDDFENDVSLINYSAFYGSVKCFKYLMLNNGEINEDSFYFAIYGLNNEIIKIIEQQNLANSQTNTNNNDMVAYLNINRDQSFISFWFPYNHMSPFIQNAIMNKEINFDKYNNDNIQCMKIALNERAQCYLNYSNINNIIAPTIALHQNDLFDWCFENKFINNNNNNNSGLNVKYIANLSALSGNAHSLIEIIDNGFYVTKKLISCSARNGFLKLTELLLNLYDKKQTENSDDSFDFESIVHFGNLSIFELFMNIIDKPGLKKAFLHAIEVNSTTIIQFILSNLDKFEFKIIDDDDFIKSALKLSLRIKSIVLFNYLVDKFKKLNPNLFNLNLFSDLLKKACLDSNLEVTKILTDFILNEDHEYDFTDAFFAATSSKSTEICQYFFDKKVTIDFKNSNKISDLGLVNIELYEKIINNVDPNFKFLFNECINKAIQSKNLNVIEFILKEKPPIEDELIEAILTDDIEVVDLVLKYNSKPSFVNKMNFKGLPLCIAVEHKNLSIFKRLLSVPGIDATLCNINNQSALPVAVKNLGIDIVNAFLDFIGDDIQPYMSIIYDSIDHLEYRYMCAVDSFSHDEWEILKKLLSLKSINPNLLDNSFNHRDKSLLYMACFDGRIDIVEFLLNFENIDTNLCDSSTFNTPLMISLERKNVNIANLLINHPKTNINIRNNNKETALIIAVKNNLNEIIDLLVNDERFDPIESRLNFAFIYSNDEIVDQLCSLSCLDVNQEFIDPTKNHAINALYHSVEINDVDKIDKIIQHQSFNIKKSNINEIIFLSAEKNNIEVFKKLMKLIDDDINIVNNQRQSLLAYSSKFLSGDIVDWILNNEHFDSKSSQLLNAFVQSYSNIPTNIQQQQQQALVQNRAIFHRTRFQQAQFRTINETNQNVLNVELLPFSCSIIEMMEKLLDYDNEHDHVIKFNELLSNGKSFFTSIHSEFENISEICEFLISHGVDVNKSDRNGIFPLEHAIIIDSIGMVKSLVNSEKIEYSQLNNGFSYLHIAARNKESTILSFLLEKNVIDVNSVNVLGETPLFEACKKMRVDNINLLIHKENIDYLHKNNRGKDALDMFISLQKDEEESIKKDKDEFYNKLIAVINEMLDPNK